MFYHLFQAILLTIFSTVMQRNFHDSSSSAAKVRISFDEDISTVAKAERY